MKTKKINVYNQKQRRILCVANKYDCRDNGTIIHEEELKVGEQYTFVKGEVYSRGSVVHLKEFPRKYGYQSCLFEELPPYDEPTLERGYNQMGASCRESVLAKLECMKKNCEERDDLYEKQNGVKRKKEKDDESLGR